jgi:uncharacterized protein
MAVGGGVGGIVVILLVLLAGGDPSALLGEGGEQGAPPPGGGLQECTTAGDVESQAECRFVVVENSLREFWVRQFEASRERYADAGFTTFTGAVSTGCGSASSQVGPFYCPADRGVYLDLGFFEVLRTRLGAKGGDFAEAYVLAHEYGHHVQNLTGQMERVSRSDTGESSDAVRLELQADCYAGVWAFHATTTQTRTGQPLITEITRDDIAEAVDAAETVGDDYIQERMGGTVSPETWTHGSSEQRRRWFEKGLASGDPNGCDTFAPGALS